MTFWRDINPGGQQQVLDDVAQLQARGFPVRTVWIDNPWEINAVSPAPPTHGGACNGTLQFDPVQFPDPKAMIETLHARGVRLGLWISSFVRPVDRMTIDGARSAFNLIGLETDHLTDVHVRNSTFTRIANPNTVQHVDNLRLSNNVTINGSDATPLR